MLDILTNPYINRKISRYLKQRDRKNLLKINADLFYSWKVLYLENKWFHLNQILKMDKKDLINIFKLKNFYLKNLDILTYLVNLKELHFSDSFNCEINQKLPKILKTIHFGKNFNRRIHPNTLPSSLRFLTFKYHSLDYTQIFDNGILPSSLEVLKIYHCWDDSIGNINSKYIPPNLKKLVVKKTYDVRSKSVQLKEKFPGVFIKVTPDVFYLKNEKSNLSEEITIEEDFFGKWY